MGLDQIKVELLSTWEGRYGGDGTVAHAAWASSTDIEKLGTKSAEDIRRIATNVVNYHHDTPKERLWMEFFVTAPIFVERQFDKYRMTVQYQDFQIEFLERPMGGDHITQNELSGRYRTIPERMLALPKDVAEICNRVVAGPDSDKYNWSSDWEEITKVQQEEYQQRIEILKNAEKSGRITNAEYKRAREVWRGILGTATLTDFRIVMNLNAFEHIINQRIEPAAQLESRVVAYRMLKELILSKAAPITVGRMVEVNGWHPSYVEVEDALAAEMSVSTTLSPEDKLWLEILSKADELKDLCEEDVFFMLDEGGFPDELISQYLIRRSNNGQ